MQVEVCKLDAIPKLASIISQVDEEDNVYGIVGRKDKLKKVCTPTCVCCGRSVLLHLEMKVHLLIIRVRCLTFRTRYWPWRPLVK
jgi:hypothetical protein